MTSTAVRLKWKSKKFFKGFILWFICIPINFVPVIMVYINSIESYKYTTVKDLVSAVVNDIDFTFVFIAVLFVLPLQGLFADYCDIDFQSAGKVCSVACYFCSAFLLMIYILCRSNPVANKLLYAKHSLTFNIIISILTIVAGAAVHILISIEKSIGEETGE